MQAITIAGGEGQRLRPYTEDRPKPMVPVGSKPILEHQVVWLRENGVTHVVVACGYMHEVIEDYFGDGDQWGVRISYSIEDSPLGRGGALKKAYRQLTPGEAFVIATNSDNINTQPLAPMIRRHKRTKAVATLLLTQLRSPYGIAREDGRRILGFREKPLLNHWLSAGVYILSPEFFAGLPNIGDHEDELFPRLASQGKLYGFRSRSYWKAIDTVKDLKEAEQALAEIEAAAD